MDEIHIKAKTTPAVRKVFTLEEIKKFAEESLGERLRKPIASEVMTLHLPTKAGELITYTFFQENKWRCYMGFADEIGDDIPEDPGGEWIIRNI
jgi:hypothetical protein